MIPGTHGWRFAAVILLAIAFGTTPLHSQATGNETSQLPKDAAPTEHEADTNTQADPETMLPHFHDTRFWLSGQANFIFQAHPDFDAPYSGKNSLNPRYEKATSRVLTLYTGVRLNDSTELLVDVEETGGAALSTGLGLAGAPNLDIVRNPLLSKAPYLGRGMIHKVFALSKDKVENNRSYLSLFDELPRRRLGDSCRQILRARLLRPEFRRLRHSLSIRELVCGRQWRLGLRRRHARLYRRRGRGLRRSQLGISLCRGADAEGR